MFYGLIMDHSSGLLLLERELEHTSNNLMDIVKNAPKFHSHYSKKFVVKIEVIGHIDTTGEYYEGTSEFKKLVDERIKALQTIKGN